LAAVAQVQPKLLEEVVVRWWLVPIYAVYNNGTPVRDLTPDDLEVYIKNLKVEKFDIHKKNFQVTETKKRLARATEPQAPPQKKMVFLVFDTAFSPRDRREDAKRMAELATAISDQTAQYVLLTIEPFAGLHYIFGPTRDPKLLEDLIKKYGQGKTDNYYTPSDMELSMDRLSNSGGFIDRTGGSRGYELNKLSAAFDHSAWLDKRRIAASYASALMTLDVVLGQFKEFSKVIYLFSSGIPADALLDRTEVPQGRGQGNDVLTVYYSFDSIAYDTLKTIGQHFNKSGALLFIINPAGTEIAESDKDSGEPSLRILTAESGGRYYEGSIKQVAEEVKNMEGGYYEISFPDKPEYEGQELNFKIRSKKPDVEIFTVKMVGREKSYADMTELEREATVMNILNEGPFYQTGQKVSYVAADSFKDGDSLVCQLRLPEEIARSEWTVYKVARDFATGQIFMDKEVIVPESASVELKMKWRGKEFRHDIVLAHTKTGTIVVWK
jgi:hypothetical protein